MSKTKNTTVNPYIIFNGNCLEAMTFYKEVFNAKLETLTFEGSPVEVSDNYKDKILHSTMTFGDATFMASDSMPDQKMINGDAYSLSVNASSHEEAERFFNALSHDGKIIMPFEDTFWEAKFGMCIDQFGISWMVSCEVEK